MHKIIIFIIILFLISNVSASCNETQININTASLEELDKIVNIGPARAQQIISLRPFESVDGLIDVVGIGNATLEEIKSQGLACVNDETKDTGENTSQKIVKAKETITSPVSNEPVEEYFPENFSMSKITVNAQNIKTKDEEKNNSNYAIYGLVLICILLVVLFTIKKFRKNKNEFRE